MAESINDIAIKLSVDAAGVSKGFRTAAEEARSYKAELDRLVYAVGKNDPVDYNAHVQQFMQATNERLAREKKAQEEFNAWYNKEMDREVAMFIAAETQKEQATQARIAAERQAALYTHNMQQIIEARPLPAESEARGAELIALEGAIRKRYALLDQEQQLIQNQVAMNTRNAQRFQATLEMETTARAQSNADLQAAITARYALLDTEERAARDNAANLVAIQSRAAITAEQLRQQDLRNLKAYIIEKYAAEDRQTNINVFNAQRFQAVPEAETMARALSNDKLEEAIRARYALLDQDERAIRENAANKAAAMLRANVDAQRLHEQDLQNLREYITQKYTILNREEAIEKMNASNAAEIARIKTLRTKQAADAANAQRDADFVAYKADLARQEAEGMINAEKMARIERARQRDAKRASDDDRVRQLNDWRQQQAMMQRAAIDTQLGTTRMAGGFGGAAMAIGQASYAAEDFIQVLSMGGGLNMALMSASNNLSMVVRSLLGASTAMAAVAGIAVPAVLIGTNLLIQHMLKEEEQIDLVTAAYKRLQTELEYSADARGRELQHRFNMDDISAIATYAAATAKLSQETRELAKSEANISDIEEEIVQKRNEIRDSLAGGTIVAEAQKILDLKKQMQGVYDWMEIATTEDEVRQLTAAYSDLAEAMKTGTADEMVRAAEEYKRILEDVRVLDFQESSEIAKLDVLLQTNPEGIDKLQELRDMMAEINAEQDKRRKSEEAVLELQDRQARLLRQELQLRQDEIRFRLTANDAQRESLNIQNQLAAFLGVDNPNPMTGLDPNDFSAEQVRQSAEFLELMWRDLERQKQELLEEQKKVAPIGDMEQNAFQAQADAFRQTLDAQFREEDPQMTELIRAQNHTNDILEGMTGIRIIQ